MFSKPQNFTPDLSGALKKHSEVVGAFRYANGGKKYQIYRTRNINGGFSHVVFGGPNFTDMRIVLKGG